MLNKVTAFYDFLPRWVRVAFWLAFAGAVTNLAAAVTNGTIAVNPAWFAVVNVVLVAIKDFANSRATQ